MASDASKSIIRAGIRANCPLQIRPNKAQPLAFVDYDSDLSPLTTGPSSAASTPFEERLEEEFIQQLTYPEQDQSYFQYHQSKFPKPRTSVSHADAAEEERDIVDDPALAEEIIKKNVLTNQLFAALCPWNFNETSIFLYGTRLTSPQFLAELLANNDQIRVYEQAARMYPAKLKGYQLASIGNTEIVTVAEATDGNEEEHEVEGYVLFSTSIRERVLIQNSRGAAFKAMEAHATVMVSGEEVNVPVQTTKFDEEWISCAASRK